MKKNMTIFSLGVGFLFFAFALLTCDVSMAGPLDNTREIQQKAARSAAGMLDVSAKPNKQKPVDIERVVTPQESSTENLSPVSDEMSGQSAEEQPVEEEKIKIEISQEEIDARIPSYKNNLKDIIREAEAKIKKIDEELKAEDAEKGAKEHYDKGYALYNEGKFEEAGAEWNSALGLAKERDFRRCIRASLKRAARQIRQAKAKREAEEWAKRKAELRGKPEPAKTEAEPKK